MELFVRAQQSDKMWTPLDIIGGSYDCLAELEVGRDVASEEDDGPGSEKALSLAYENLEHVPTPLAASLGSRLTALDLSHNKLSDVEFLNALPALSTLVLDHNLLTAEVSLPRLPRLRLLWINHNKVTRLQPLVKRLYHSLPQLRHLSLIGNRAAPSPLTGAEPGECARYRLSMVWYLPHLEHLDERPVTDAERARSQHLQLRAICNSLQRYAAPVRRNTCI